MPELEEEVADRSLEQAEEEIKKLGTEMAQLEKELGACDEEMLILKESAQDQLGDLAELIQGILDRTKDDRSLRSQIQNLCNNLRCQQRKPRDNYSQLDLPELAIATFHPTSRAA